ncbi:phosphatidylglycerophosphatase A [Bryobacter aggregatus]|uniref:phosphatidylglycerophosphatase A family protein n=1 Tax=Bryobacter aggregatus TaxID=360054 RepID=UPI0004E1E4B3|nr:phosphatidylglycerophosphatase A [Bryobacter aggregatus]
MRFAIAEVIATSFYAGYTPKAPGTAGALFGVLLVYLLHRYAFFIDIHFALLSAVLLLPSIWASNQMIDTLQLKDPQCIVIDEVLGQVIAFTAVVQYSWLSYLVAFLLFRAFDIWKPFPVNMFEKLPRGLGVMADDLMAGVYAAFVIYLLRNFGNMTSL